MIVFLSRRPPDIAALVKREKEKAERGEHGVMRRPIIEGASSTYR
jgi:hypothetical protein